MDGLPAWATKAKSSKELSPRGPAQRTRPGVLRMKPQPAEKEVFKVTEESLLELSVTRKIIPGNKRQQ